MIINHDVCAFPQSTFSPSCHHMHFREKKLEMFPTKLLPFNSLRWPTSFTGDDVPELILHTIEILNEFKKVSKIAVFGLYTKPLYDV